MSKKRIKVLWFSNTPANGAEHLGLGGPGSGSWLRTLDVALQDRVDLHVAFYHSSDCEYRAGSTHYWAIARYQSHLEKIVGKIGERFFDRVLDEEHLNRYISIIEKVKPDVIHIHGSENPFGAITGKTPVPVVVSIQGLICAVLNAYNQGLGERYLHVRSFRLDSFKNALFPTNFNNTKLKFQNMALVEKKNLKHCQYVIGRTDWDHRMTQLLAPQSQYFHNDEIMRGDFFLAQWSVPTRSVGNRVVIHTTADNVYYKGLETIVDAIQHLKEIGVQCTWRIAGVDTGDLVVRVLKKRSGHRFPHDSLIFMGKVPAKQLIESMLAADCYVLTSNIENSPNVLCEAMLLGMPCIATHAGGVGSFITHGKNGYLVQPGDSYSVASCITDIVSNPSKSQALGLAAKADAMVRHNPDTIVNDLILIYETIIENQRAQSSHHIKSTSVAHVQ
jgi:glycosyltransferase involved in cell wall biosynthesis